MSGLKTFDAGMSLAKCITRRLQRPRVRLRRGPVDGAGGGGGGRARVGDLRLVVRAIRVAGQRPVHRRRSSPRCARSSAGTRRRRNEPGGRSLRQAASGLAPRRHSRPEPYVYRAVRRDRGPGQAQAAAGAVPPVLCRAAARQVPDHRHLAAEVRVVGRRLRGAREGGHATSSATQNRRVRVGRVRVPAVVRRGVARGHVAAGGRRRGGGEAIARGPGSGGRLGGCSTWPCRRRRSLP